MKWTYFPASELAALATNKTSLLAVKKCCSVGWNSDPSLNQVNLGLGLPEPSHLMTADSPLTTVLSSMGFTNLWGKRSKYKVSNSSSLG